MKPEKNYIKPLNIKETLLEDQYVIPIYQRGFSWESKEIDQLIQDIIDYSKNHKNKNYYLGTLVVSRNKIQSNSYDTIDGQQRLTTLSILSSVIKKEYPEIELHWFEEMNIQFASRNKSKETLKAVFIGDFPSDGYDPKIHTAYEICKSELKNKLEESKLTINEFAQYLYEYVKIIRVELPDGIDLNHYFEIMNSRGEQLEKHEILKARLMSYFDNSDNRTLYVNCFNMIWEACANMEKYVQFGFKTEHRHIVFGKNDWNELSVLSFDDMVNKIHSSYEKNKEFKTSENEQLSNIDEIIELPIIDLDHTKVNDQSERFSSVINFPNFLLHVLRIQIDKDEVALDDKRLIDIFESCIPKDEVGKENFSKEFIYNLLKCKFLLDKYIIKREFTANSSNWSLKSLNWYRSGNVKNAVKYINTFSGEERESFDNENRQILMLLSMFHVSIPSMSYKYWLNAALRYVFHLDVVIAGNYIKYLEHIAKSFVFDYFLGKNEVGYFEMINKNLSPIHRSLDDIDLNRLTYGNIKNNLLFNFFDYLLWKENNENRKDLLISRFEFTPRSSVEHYYPQRPFENSTPVIESVYLNSFGNLCLISSEKNSRLNNYSPKSKKEHYANSKTIDSIKQYLMIKEEKWGIEEIEEHYKKAVDLIGENLDSHFKWEIKKVSKARNWFKLYKASDKILLVRALMCFGQIDQELGWTSGMYKYNFYQWSEIENSEAYLKFEEYVNEKDPQSLEEIIEDNLKNNIELREDSYRYAFVSRPYILDYCKEGNFGWDNDGKNIILLAYSKATLHQSCDLYCLCLFEYLRNLMYDVAIDRDGLDIYLYIKDYMLVKDSDVDSDSVVLKIWNNNEGHICYELDAKHIHKNSKVIRNLINNEWEYNNDKKLYLSTMPYLAKLSTDVENNILKVEKRIHKIINKLII